MSCKTCSDLQAKLEAAARELSRSVQEAQVAIQPISGVAVGNRIESAEHSLHAASQELEAHKAICAESN